MLNKLTKQDLILLHHMIIHKIQLQFSDQLFGYGWALINPLVYIFSFWFFAYAGIRTGETLGMPYVIWVIPGLLIYRLISGIFTQSPSMLINNASLIKETGVNVKFIPLIESLKECYVHVGVMLVMFILFSIVGYTMTGTFEYLPNIYYLNFIYYWFTAFVYSIVLAYIVSAIGVVFRDTKNIVGALMVPIFWMTPVLFAVEHGINPFLEKLEKVFNPFYYFINGYRNTMLYEKFFFEDVFYNIYMWIIIIIMIIFARRLWSFLTPIIADIV